MKEKLRGKYVEEDGKYYYHRLNNGICTEICPFKEDNIKIGSFYCRRCEWNLESCELNMFTMIPWLICHKIAASYGGFEIKENKNEKR